MEDNADTKSETPVAPPSINLLVNKKPFKPKDAEKIPIVISAKSLICPLVEMRDSLYLFAF